MSVSYEELERLRRLYPLLEALYNVLGEFLGKKPAPAPVAKAEAPEPRKLVIAPEKVPRIEVPRVPIFRAQPYTDHLFIKAAQPIDDKERVFDLGGLWELVIVRPEVDAYIEFDRPITDRTPVVPGGTTLEAEMFVREIHYKSAVSGLTGDLSVWVWR